MLSNARKKSCAELASSLRLLLLTAVAVCVLALLPRPALADFEVESFTGRLLSMGTAPPSARPARTPISTSTSRSVKGGRGRWTSGTPRSTCRRA